MIEGYSNGLNGDAVKDLVTNCFLNAISQKCSREILQQQVADSVRSTEANLSVCFYTQSERIQRERDGQRDQSKGQGDHTAQKMFAESILNTVVEVTIYLMPAKLARTSGAGYLVQLFMISSKI